MAVHGYVLLCPTGNQPPTGSTMLWPGNVLREHHPVERSKASNEQYWTGNRHRRHHWRVHHRYSPVHYTMKIRKLPGTGVGAGVSVLPRDGDYSTTRAFFGRHRAYYWWSNGNSNHYNNGSCEPGEKCSKWKVGDVITFTLDCEQRTLQILVSRTGKSATLNDLVVTSPLYPTVCMSFGTEVELC